MRHHVLGSGAIACSAIALWSFITLPKSHTDQSCGGATTQAEHNLKPTRSNCAANQRLRLARIGPERWFNLNWERDRRHLPADLEKVYAQLLQQAQATAKQDHWATAIAQVSGIPKNSQHYTLAQQLQSDWAQEIVQQAMEHYQQGQLKTALNQLAAIPAANQHYAQVQALIQQWSREANWLQQAEVAWRSGRWYQVLTTLKQFENSPLYQSNKVQGMVQGATTKLYEADPALTEISSTTAAANPAIAPPGFSRQPEFSQSAADVDPLPPPIQLPIATKQALTWTQPPKAIASQSHSALNAKTSSSEPPPPLPQTPMNSKPMLFPYTRPTTTATTENPAIDSDESLN